jgi:hypothetical protein
MLNQADSSSSGAGAGLLILVFALYFLPTVIALVRKVQNVGPVVIINVFLGWSIIGWIVALAMAFGSTTPSIPKTPAGTFTAGLIFTHSGTRFLFGHTVDPPAYAIWDRLNPGQPIERFPYSDHGKSEGLSRFQDIETKWIPVGPAPPMPPIPPG